MTLPGPSDTARAATRLGDPHASRLTAAASDASRLTAVAGDASTGPARCDWCGGVVPSSRRRDARFCQVACRQASWRFGIRATEAVASGQPMRFAYADPPYPGKAAYYVERQEVDHASLVDRLRVEYPDGWALSTSSEAVRDVWALCPEARLHVWVKGGRHTPSRRALSSWEALLVAGGRPLRVVDDVGRPVVQDLEDSLVYGGRYRAFPGALVGMKPPQFAVWMFRLLGATRSDHLVDVFPGSGAVTEAWRRYVGYVDETRPAVDGRRVGPAGATRDGIVTVPPKSDTARLVTAASAAERAIADSARLITAASAAERAIADVHEVRPCPRCKAPVGTRCRNVSRTYARGRELEHPHRQRYTGMER